MTTSARARTVHAFTAAFGTCDIDTIVACVADDLVWELNGVPVGEGRAAFEAQMRHDLAAGRAEVTIEQIVEQDDTLVVLQRGRFVPHEGGDGFPVVSAEVYTFAGDRIARIRTYQSVG